MAEIQIGVEELLRHEPFFFHLATKSREPVGMSANIFQIVNPCRPDLLLCVADQITYKAIEHALQGFVEL